MIYIREFFSIYSCSSKKGKNSMQFFSNVLFFFCFYACNIRDFMSCVECCYNYPSSQESCCMCCIQPPWKPSCNRLGQGLFVSADAIERVCVIGGLGWESAWPE